MRQFNTGWHINSATSLLDIKLLKLEQSWLLWSLEFVIRKFSMILEDFSSLKPGTVFCMVSLVKKKSIPVRSENLESGPTAFQVIFPGLQILGKISSHVFFEH